MRIVYIYILSLFISFNAFSQSIVIEGKVTDQEGVAVPFASVYEKNTSNGTSANSEGEYKLKLSAGYHEIIYKSIGYSQVARSLNLVADQRIDIVLPRAIYQLNDVIVKAGAEDPAYEVIRNAIRNRKTHLEETEQYTVNVYIKGMQKLLAAPRKFLGKDIEELGKEIGLDSNRRGILYLSESE